MAEETEEVTEQTETETPPETETKPRPESLPEDQEWDRVDFETADAKTIQRRFNRLYAGQMQTNKALELAAADNRKLVERIEKFEAQQEADRTSTRVSELKQEKVKALEEGETARAVEIDDQILDLKTAPKEVKETPKEEVQEPNWFTPARQQELVNWAAATNEKGDYRRPWAQPDHPRNAQCVEFTNGVLSNPDFAGAEMSEILSEVDRLMTPRQTKPTGSAVLSGEGAPRPKENKGIKLTEEQKLVARKMYNDMPPADAIKRYEKSLARIEGAE